MGRLAGPLRQNRHAPRYLDQLARPLRRAMARRPNRAHRSIERSCVRVAHAAGRNLVGFLTRGFGSHMSEETMSRFATTLRPRTGRWILIAASLLALLGSFAVASSAQASDYYGSYPQRYGYGASRYGYYPSRCSCCRPCYPQRCDSCGCQRCGCGGCRPRVVERRWIERQYVERRYGCCSSNSYYPRYRSYGSTPFPYGYGGVRRSYGYGPANYEDDGADRPPAAVGYDGGQYGDEGGRWE